MKKKLEERKWFKDLKKTRKNFVKVENAIEAFKFKYDRENHLVEWIMGISVVILLSLSIVDVLNSPTEWIRIVGFWAYIIAFGAILITIALHILVNFRQKKAIGYLYKEKDKQESKTK